MPSSRKRPTLFPSRESARLLRQLTGREHALLAGRGAAGIWAALRAAGFQNRPVLIPAHTCYIVLWVVLKSGNRPLLYDAEVPSSEFQVPSFSEKPAAIIPCHLYGLPAPISVITTWAREQGVMVIEDAALALGATIEGKPAGSWGDASIFSFGQGKIADHDLGGVVLTDDGALAQEMEKVLSTVPEWDHHLMQLTNQWNGLYWSMHQYESQNPHLLDLYPRLFEIYGDLTAYRLPDEYWRGFPGMLADLPENLAHRALLAEHYDQQVDEINNDLGGQSLLKTFPRPAGSILWRYPLLVASDIRDDVLSYLWEMGIHDATRWYPSLRYMASALAPDMPPVATPQADALGASIINLRVDSDVDTAQVDQTMNLIRHFLREL
jgi:dTDP-4-amino-4,6-dideoxygalactose transaminase